VLSEHQYALIGRLSFVFNDLEWFLQLCLEWQLGTPEPSVAEVLAAEGTFNGRICRFEKVLEAIKKDASASESDIDAVLAVLACFIHEGTTRCGSEAFRAA